MTPPRSRTGAIAALLVPAAVLAAPAAAFAQAADASALQDLEPQLPVEVQDAEPARPGVREAQLPIRMTRERDGDNRFLVEPRIRMGFARNWQARIGIPFVVGSTDRTNSGNVRGDVLWRAIDEGSLFPAIGLNAALELPTGKNAHGTDLTLGLLASKTLGATPGTHRVHANAFWRMNDDRQPGERRSTERFILGYSTPLSPSTLVVADVGRGHGRLGATGMSSFWEIGLRQAWVPGTTVSLGFARGSGEDAPNWQVTAGLQTQF